MRNSSNTTVRWRKKYGLKMIVYEGGTHIVGFLPEELEDEEFTNFLIALNNSEGMGEIYKDMLDMWDRVGGSLFGAFNDVGST